MEKILVYHFVSLANRLLLLGGIIKLIKFYYKIEIVVNKISRYWKKLTIIANMIRLDNYILQNSLALSRNKAQELIASGAVSINGAVNLKNSTIIGDNDVVVVKKDREYVSRSAYKLDAFLDELDIDIKNKIALDIGSSSGGFTQVLLERGSKCVYAVDVGKDQLHQNLREDARVKLFEECDIRDFKSNETFELVVCDVAFISLHHILKDIHRLSSRDIILLFKPQFEVGKDVKRDKKGVVSDKKAIDMAMMKLEDAIFLLGWRLVKKSPSKLSGKEGNLEYCYYYIKDQNC